MGRSKVELIPQKRMVKTIAMTQEAQDGVFKKAEQRAARARLILSIGGHGAAPHASIELQYGDGKGRTDAVIILNDSRGQEAAMTIEFGRKGGNFDKNGKLVTPSEAVAPLRKAVDLR